ncbi:GyrI-like domain-containing protein [Paenibacillus tuaregi]|uniref:GyrI-like domain-containing protein n=1 Tax=Paenibacillus tuaregi TaxID=1816681 RepID=UPI000839387B|nr:effector binding domain-containing protein [Paenibacillus tuaregi]
MNNNSYIQQPGFKLSGVSVRTTNEREMGPDGYLPKLWETYFSSPLPGEAAARGDRKLYALYTDYESDASGAYTVLIGHEALEAGDSVGEATGLEQASVPAAKYKVFTTAKGPVYQVVAQAWGEIWAYFGQSEEQRTYTGDLELYDTRNFNPEETVVQIYIAIK